MYRRINIILVLSLAMAIVPSWAGACAASAALSPCHHSVSDHMRSSVDRANTGNDRLPTPKSTALPVPWRRCVPSRSPFHWRAYWQMTLPLFSLPSRFQAPNRSFRPRLSRPSDLQSPNDTSTSTAVPHGLRPHTDTSDAKCLIRQRPDQGRSISAINSRGRTVRVGHNL